MEVIEFNSIKKTLTLSKRAVPTIEDGNQVLIKVAYTGVCGTDLHIIQGEFPAKQDGIILGHEFSGTIAKIGTAVTEFQVGDRVAVDPNRGCRVCSFCHSGEPHFCLTGSLQDTLGIFRNGGWAEYCLVPDYQVTKLPSSITLAQAALCEPLSCLAHGWDKISPVPVGKNVLIIGAGIIGNLWAITLHLQGHRRVTISEPNPHRRKQLEKLDTGFDAITPEDLQVRQKRGVTYDLIIDCSGFGPAIENAVNLLNLGGTLCIFGVAAPHTKISIPPYKLYDKELSIVGVRINQFSFPKAIGLLDALGERYLDYGKLGIKVFKLSEYELALQNLKEGIISKAIFKL